MANLIVKDASGTDVEIRATGVGSTGDPFVMSYQIGTALPVGSNVIGGVTQSGTWDVNAISSALPAGTNNIGAVTSVNNIVAIAAEFTRPTNTDAYAINDAVNNSTSAPALMQFTNIASANGRPVTITSITIEKSTSSTTNAAFALVLFNTSFAGTTPNDNAAYSPTYAERANRLAIIPVGQMQSYGAGGSAVVTLDSIAIDVLPAGGSRTIQGLLVALGAYTPGNAETFWVRIVAQQH